ncbi:MAG: glycosyltransferase family 1 protein [bacterium]
MERLRVAINAQLLPEGPYGGIITVLRALAALPELADGSEDYVFIGPYENPEWMRAMLPPGQRIERGPMSFDGWKVDRLELFKRHLGPFRPMAGEVKRLLLRKAQGLASLEHVERPSAAANQREFFESLDCDVIHFPFQTFEPCDVPFVFNPHDVQHLHLPEFFTAAEISRRESLYPAACRAAHTVVVASNFVKRDIVDRYGIDSNKVQVIPWGPPPLPRISEEQEESDDRAIRRKYDFADTPFALYPAMTWEHKNHIRLLEAMASQRDSEALDLRIICSGFKTDFWPSIKRRLHQLGLSESVTFPGLVPAGELNALYRAAQFVFVPSVFEAASAPVYEAWQSGVPVACSSVTSLPEQVGDAALLFDPFSVKEIAAALSRMANDATLREDLRIRGAQRLRDFDLKVTAKAYRAVYRRAAGRTLSEEDRQLLGYAKQEKSAEKFEVQRG